MPATETGLAAATHLVVLRVGDFDLSTEVTKPVASGSKPVLSSGSRMTVEPCANSLADEARKASPSLSQHVMELFSIGMTVLLFIAATAVVSHGAARWRACGKLHRPLLKTVNGRLELPNLHGWRVRKLIYGRPGSMKSLRRSCSTLAGLASQ